MGELCSDCYKREFVTDTSIWGFGFYFGKNHCSKAYNKDISQNIFDLIEKYENR
ncbi:MAG: hypothetical protein ACI4FO_03415 [Acutalibacteraceae bacterium]